MRDTRRCITVVAAFALILPFSPAAEARVRVTTSSDTGGPADSLESCVSSALVRESDPPSEADRDFHAWLFVSKLEGLPAGPHAIQLLITVDEPEAKQEEGGVGLPVRLAAWRSFQGTATDAALCGEIAEAIRRGVGDVGRGFRIIDRE